MTHPLLTPRYMVEADYPNSPFRVGDVLELSETTIINGEIINYKKYPPLHLEVDMLNQYPHIFRPMHWSEQRELSELPRYLKRKDSVIHVQEYYNSDGKGLFVRTINGSVCYPIEWYTPATEAEYLEYLKSKEK